MPILPHITPECQHAPEQGIDTKTLTKMPRHQRIAGESQRAMLLSMYPSSSDSVTSQTPTKISKMMHEQL